jgi:hypothetical protein
MVGSSGLTNLHRISQLAWELAFEYRDHDAPKLFPVSVRNLSHGWNSSNAVYYVGVIDGTRRYRLRGSRGHAPFVEVGIYDNLDGFGLPGSGGGQRISSVDETQLGSPGDQIDIEIGPNAAAPRGLPTSGAENVVFIRQYAHDWSATPPARDLYLEPLDAPKAVSYDARVARGLADAPGYVENHLGIYHKLITGQRARGTNAMYDVPRDTASTLPAGHHYIAGNFELGPDQAMVLEFDPVDAPYWSVELGDFWGQTLDYDRTLDEAVKTPIDEPVSGSHLHDRQVRLSADGKAVIRIGGGPRPAGTPNWLDTKGHSIGFIVYRQFRMLDRFPRIKAYVERR